MKTEPTETLKSLIREVYDVYESDGQDIENIVNYEEAEKAVRSAFEEGQLNPKIKQLEWMVSEGGETMLANIPFNDYYLIDGTDGMIFLTINNQHHMEIYDTIDEAKAAAQADFERRVMECFVLD